MGTCSAFLRLNARISIHIEEEPEPGDLEAIAEGRAQIERGEFITLEQLEHELGSDSL